MGSRTKPEGPPETTDGWEVHSPRFNGDAPETLPKLYEWQYHHKYPDEDWTTPNPHRTPSWYAAVVYRVRAANGRGLPDDNPKTAQGALKTPLLSVVPASALLQMGEVMRLGKAKYGPFNWRSQPVTYSTYIDAAMRHLMQFWDGETTDPESGQSHLAHAMAGLAVLSDAIATGNATDDRPEPGAASTLIENFKKARQG